MFSYTSHRFFFLTRKEFWFYDGEKINDGTYSVFSSAKKVYGSSFRNLDKYRTTQIDLLKSQNEILKAIHPTLRYDLRIAGKKGMEFLVLANPSETDCNQIIRQFNEFIKNKPIDPLPRKWIKFMRKSGRLFITRIHYKNENVVTHILMADKNSAIITQSFHNPFFENPEISRLANKYLHWKDIIYFKDQGFRFYSFGPINNELKGITQFKLRFGGEIAEYYRYIVSSKFVFSMVDVFKKCRKAIRGISVPFNQK